MSDTHPAIMICGHGSRDKRAVEEFNQLAVRIKERLPKHHVESGFLEFATPVIGEGLDKLRDAGAKKIVCLPGMLFAAGHVKNDLPSEVNTYAAANDGVEMVFAADLGIDARLLDAAQQRIEEALDASPHNVSREDTLVLVVGRGTNDSDANSNVAKVTRMLWEGLNVGWAETAYSGVAYPLADQALARVTRLGFKRVVVFPYFLFSGILVSRIYNWVDAAAAANPHIEFLKASYLNDHPKVIDAFIARLEEALNGTGNMNCQLCKYREQIIGHEHDLGAAQVGHHHHVQGAGVEDNPEDRGVHHGHGHPHAHEHDHGHDHGHHNHDHGHSHDHDHKQDHGDCGGHGHGALGHSKGHGCGCRGEKG
ncbi:MAG: sirohydrochlorin chelatase [Rhodospirillales bacterium]|nr:sirohydrochlorin chelatase [Rhodospirillales bacterium]